MRKILYIYLSFLSINSNAQNGTYQVDETAFPTFTDLTNLVTSIGTNSATIHINKTITLTDNDTIPENISLIFYNRAVINLAGKTLTINGPIEAGAFQIFSGIGTVNGNPKIDYAHPEWWKDPSVPYWTTAIQKAVDFYPKIIFQSRDYYIDNTILLNLNKQKNFNIYGNGRSTNIYCNNDVYIFKMESNYSFPTHSSIENIHFHCKKGIRINDDSNESQNNQILNFKINRCIFSHDQGDGIETTIDDDTKDIAINLYEVFDSTISENLIQNFDIGIKQKGCDINSIYDNRIQGFNLYGVLNLSHPENDYTGSQTSIFRNDILTYNGTNSNEGAFIKSNSYHVIIKDNFLENGLNEIFAYVDCSNINLNTNLSFPYNLDITGNRLSTGARFSYLINEEFKSLNLNDIPLALPIENIPPSSFCKNLNALETVRTLKVDYEDRPRHINVFNVFSFKEWSSFNSTNIFQIENNGVQTINSRNFCEISHDPDGHTARFNPKSLKIKNTKYIKFQISQKLSGELDELNSLPKNLIIKIITRNINIEDVTTNNNDYFVAIKSDKNTSSNIWQGFGEYNCHNGSDPNYNNYKTYIIKPGLDFNSSLDYWLLISASNSDKEIMCIIIEPDESKCYQEKNVENNINIKDINELKVYPNPVDNILKIDLGNNSTIKSILIYDLNGRLIENYTDKIVNQSINVSSLPAGNFIVKIVSENNTSKIILKK